MYIPIIERYAKLIAMQQLAIYLTGTAQMATIALQQYSTIVAIDTGTTNHSIVTHGYCRIIDLYVAERAENKISRI
jgi:hypothetical protein